MSHRSQIVTDPPKRGRGRPKLYDRRTTIGLTEADYAAIEARRREGESWEACARRLLRAGIDVSRSGAPSM